MLVLFLIRLLLRCGDSEQNPGPGEMRASQTSPTSHRATEGVGMKEEVPAGMQETMLRYLSSRKSALSRAFRKCKSRFMVSWMPLTKVSFEQSIQEVKEQIYGALDAVDDLKERTKSIEEAAMNITTKNDEHSGNRRTGEQNEGNDRQT